MCIIDTGSLRARGTMLVNECLRETEKKEEEEKEEEEGRGLMQARRG